MHSGLAFIWSEWLINIVIYMFLFYIFAPCHLIWWLKTEKWLLGNFYSYSAWEEINFSWRSCWHMYIVCPVPYISTTAWKHITTILIECTWIKFYQCMFSTENEKVWYIGRQSLEYPITCFCKYMNIYSANISLVSINLHDVVHSNLNKSKNKLLPWYCPICEGIIKSIYWKPEFLRRIVPWIFLWILRPLVRYSKQRLCS